jgi:CheY-like chemotaxis protein
LPQLAPGSLPHQHVSEMYAAAQQGAQMIRKLWLFSRRRAAGQPAGQRSASLAGVLAGEFIRIQKSWLPQVHLQLDLPADLPAVAVDGDSLRQVLVQLLDNAREAIPAEGAVTLAARAVRLSLDDCLEFLGNPAPGEHVEISLTDTGCGLSPEVARRLFQELFFTTKPGRRGLGLAAVYGILQSHQGGFRFGPGRKGGTMVRLVLPQAAPSGERRAPSVERSVGTPLSASRGASFSGVKVLVVDDDPLVREMTGTILQRAGYQVQRAAGAAEALEIYATSGEEPFQLVLTDLVMPSMSGFDLARELQSLDPNVRILFLTGEIPARPQQGGRTPANVHMLGKPFRPAELLTAVRDIVSTVPSP